MNIYKSVNVKNILIIILQIALVAISLAVLAIATLLLPLLWVDIGTEFPEYAYAVYGVFIAIYISVIPFLIGIMYAGRLLSLIQKARAFTIDSAKAVRNIAFCAGSISGVYLLSWPLFYIWGERDDAPGLIVIGMILVGAPFIVAVFAVLLHRLVSDAVALKSENELTV